VTDEAGRYAGIVLTPEAHGADDTITRVSEILHYPKDVLLPQMTIKEAVQMFESTESDALAVVDAANTRNVIGLLTEQFALRRYTEELDRQRRDLSGE
jgi:CIC family chloride channel protein